MFINGQPKDLIGTFVQMPDGSLAASASELNAIGIMADGVPLDTLVPLTDLSGTSFVYDMPLQRIDFAVGLSSLVPNDIVINGTRERQEPTPSQFGLLLNYSLFALASSDWRDYAFEGASAEFEARLLSSFGTLLQSGIAGTSESNPNSFVRLDTHFTHLDDERAISYRVGDLISSGPGWSRPLRMGGIQIQRDFSLRPDLVTVPLPRMSGTAAVPSVLDVYVDNLKLMSRDVPAGPFDIKDIPAISGSGQARVVVREVSGRETELVLPFFSSPTQLAKGLLTFSAEAGVPRYAFGTESFDYAGELVGSAGVRYGLTDWLTIEASAEGSAELVNGGLGLTTNAGSLGVVALSGRFSHSENGFGARGYASLDTELLGAWVHLSTHRTFLEYDDLASMTARPPDFDFEEPDPDAPDDPDDDDGFGYRFDYERSIRAPKAIDRLSIGVPLERIGSAISLGVAHVLSNDDERSLIASLSFSQTLFRSASLTISAFGDMLDTESFGVYVGFSMPLGASGIQSSLGAAFDGEELSARADVYKSLGMEIGSVGWRASLASSTRTTQAADIAYRSSFGVAAVGGDFERDSGAVSAEFSGSVGMVGGTVFAGGWIDDAFAVVDVGASGVEVFHQNRPMGRTGWTGSMVIPALVAGQVNRINIDPTNLPIDAGVSQTTYQIVPARYSGSRVSFGVQEDAGTAVVILQDGAGALLTAGSQGRFAGTEQFFAVGYDGRAYLEGLKPGANEVSVEIAEGECHADFDFKRAPGEQIVIGPVTCAVP